MIKVDGPVWPDMERIYQQHQQQYLVDNLALMLSNEEENQNPINLTTN